MAHRDRMDALAAELDHARIADFNRYQHKTGEHVGFAIELAPECSDLDFALAQGAVGEEGNHLNHHLNSSCRFGGAHGR